MSVHSNKSMHFSHGSYLKLPKMQWHTENASRQEVTWHTFNEAVVLSFK